VNPGGDEAHEQAPPRRSSPARLVGRLRTWGAPLFPLDVGARRPLAFFPLYLVAFAAGTAVVLLRQSGPGTPAWNSMWAEDGEVFLDQALVRGFGANLFTPYAGYLHLVQSVLAQLDVHAPLADAAVLFALEGAAAATACALVVFRASRALVPSTTVRGCMAAAMLLLPLAGYELLANITNIPWFLTPTVFWALLWRPSSWKGRVVALVVTLAAAGSQPLVAVFLPIVAMRLVVLPDWREHAATLGYAVGLAGQAGSLVLRGSGSTAIGLSTFHPSAALVAQAYALRVGIGSIASSHLVDAVWSRTGILGAVGGLAVVGCLVLLGVRAAEPSARALILGSVAAGAVLFAVTTHERLSPYSLDPGKDVLQSASRYSYAPVVLLVFALALGADRALRRSRRVRVPLLLGALLVAALAAPGFHAVNARSSEEPWNAALSSALTACRPTRPNVVVLIAPPPWRVDVPCNGPPRHLAALGQRHQLSVGTGQPGGVPTDPGTPGARYPDAWSWGLPER
jgi:hypothetical protein